MLPPFFTDGSHRLSHGARRADTCAGCSGMITDAAARHSLLTARMPRLPSRSRKSGISGFRPVRRPLPAAFGVKLRDVFACRLLYAPLTARLLSVRQHRPLLLPFIACSLWSPSGPCRRRHAVIGDYSGRRGKCQGPARILCFLVLAGRRLRSRPRNRPRSCLKSRPRSCLRSRPRSRPRAAQELSRKLPLRAFLSALSPPAPPAPPHRAALSYTR